MLHQVRTGAVAVLAFAALLAVAGCESTPPELPDPASVSWITYTNPVLGYSVDVPSSFVRQENSRNPSVLFRYDGFPVVAVNFVSREEGKKRGLWVGKEPAGTIHLGNRDGKRYVYRHYDGPSYMRTMSYVVEHQGKYLGLEFRTGNEEPDTVQSRILASFRFH